MTDDISQDDIRKECLSDSVLVLMYVKNSGKRLPSASPVCVGVLPSAPSRRGDLQSLGYCMLLWHTGRLPWSALSHPDQVAAEKQR